MDFSGREEPQGAAGSGLEQMPSAANQFSYVGEEDDLSDARNSQSPDSGRDRRNGTRSGKPRPAHNRQPRETDYYLRILVPPTMVGAIIGKEGKKIKDLTEKTRTDITVHKKDEKGPFAKVVEIVGNPAQCTEANLNIHRIMRAETDPAKRSSSIMMRVLVHSGVAARVIGRGHVQLKRIMQQTPDVAVKALREDYNPLNPMDRVITVQCQLPSEQLILNEDTMLSQAEEDALLKCSEAESLISGRAYELLNCARMPFWQSPHTVFMPHHSQPPWPQMGGHTFNSPPNNPFLPHWFQGVFGNVSQGYMHLAQVPVKVHLTFPSKFAGPLIGKKASNLAHIKKFSGASRVHVLPKDRDAPERYIEIIGTPLQQYFAQHCVYCKLAEEGYKTNSDSVGELKLKTEMFIPLKGNKDQPNFIGRFIGREGHNVKELQKQTGVRIKVETSNENTENKEAVIIFEESFATGQRAQMQILEAIERCQCPPLRRQAPYS